MKRPLYLFASLLILLTACVREDIDVPQVDDVPEGYTRITFKANASSPTIGVGTRAVDPDGLDVNNMTLFCFNEFGLYISSETATLKAHAADPGTGISDKGTYEAVIPSHTRIIHFLANHSKGLYDEKDFPGQTESMVVANMEGGSGMLVYWSRFEMDAESDMPIHDQLAALKYTIGGVTYDGIKLIRNQAKVTIDDWTTEHFIVTGYRTVNIPAFGTVAPHHPEHHFHIVDNWESTEEFVTLPNNQALMSDISDINTKPEDYIFESENAGDKLISVIIKGHKPGESEANDKYYRVVMQNPDGSNFMIRRNHHYNIIITGPLSFGQDTFEEALTAPASNNAWISIDEWVNEISNGTETLWVEQTSYVLSSDEYAGTDWTFKYKYTNKNGNSAPEITWIDNNVAYSDITNNYNTSTGEGTVTLRFYPMYDGNEQQSGSLLIKHGKLQRKINIHIIRTQHFTPTWISTQVYGVPGENVTLIFTVPETCPDALFPFTVLVSANHLDIRSSSGQQLPIYIKGEEGYFGADWEGINYKYAYTVTEPGKHRLHMHSILNHTDGDLEPVHLEADFFETATKNVIFSGNNMSHYRIFVPGLNSYAAAHADDEELFYILVPQKKASPLTFTIALQERADKNSPYTALNHAANSNTNQWHKNGKDEFLIYTKYFSFYKDYFQNNPGTYEEIKDLTWEGEVTMIDDAHWSANGRVMAFRTLEYPDKDGNYTDSYHYGLQEDGTYHIYMLTNSSYNQDVVRISSNNTLSPYVFAKNRLGQAYVGNYDGNEYRSAIFDVGQYRPFRFAAQVKISDGTSSTTIPANEALLSNEQYGSKEENVDEVGFSYKPGQQVDILLDITSFKGSDGRSVHPFGETFGEEFEVYIDAPMLEIDVDRLPENWKAANKLKRDPRTPGRFIYTVSKTREAERTFGFAPAHNPDNSTKGYDNFGRVTTFDKVNQTGERKCLPFKKTSITSKGDIVISSNKEKVVYWDKTFKVNTEHIKGNIYYEKNGTQYPIPHNAFVAFVRQRTGARIGVVTITSDGKFELNLRDEYQFNWDDDPIDLFYTDGDGVTYHFNYTEGGEVKTVDLGLLYNLVKEGTPIVLTE